MDVAAVQVHVCDSHENCVWVLGEDDRLWLLTLGLLAVMTALFMIGSYVIHGVWPAWS